MSDIKQEPDVLSSMSSSASAVGQPGLMDPMDSLLDLSEFDNANQYNSPALSPATTKNSFVRTSAVSTPASMLSASQPMTGPSHQYDQDKQQTGFVPGALADVLAITQNNNPQLAGYNGFDMTFLNMNGTDEMFDFNTAPQASVSPSDIDLEFESPAADPSFFFASEQMNSATPTVTITPSANPGDQKPASASSQGNVGRLWPGMHQQAAMAKAQAQQQQQQQQIAQQQQQQQQRHRPSTAGQSQTKPMQQAPPQTQRAKSGQPSDPIVEQKITQLLSSMRAKSSSPNGSGSNGMGGSRSRKDEDDMDEDERLLASEEGKKLSSKERRQLRNKVSARAFRSRRKEYISQLEAEIAGKVTENGELRTQNRALAEENKRLSDLTRMLLGSPSFSDFLDRLSANPALVPPTSAAPATHAQPAPSAPPAQERPAPKDPNPFPAQRQIGMAMIPEQNIDFSMLQIESEPAFSFQPQVYAVLETPAVAMPMIDTSALTGKASNFVGRFDDDEKVDMPVIEHPVAEEAPLSAPTSSGTVTEDAEFDSDPAFALYHDAASPTSADAAATEKEDVAESAVRMKPVGIRTEAMQEGTIFGGIEAEKALSRLELVDASEDVPTREVEESLALARIVRIGNNLKAASSRLDMLNGEQ